MASRAGCRLDKLEREYNAEHAIEGSGVRNCVDVGAEDQALAGCAGGIPESAEIADGIDVHGHAEAFHAGTQMLMNLANRRSEKAAGDAAGLFAHGGDGAAFFDGSPCAVAHVRTSSLPRGLMAIWSEGRTGWPRSHVSLTRPQRCAPR